MSPLRPSLSCHTLAIPFVVAFRHASAERTETSTLWVHAKEAGLCGYGEGCPRPYVTGETLATARAFFDTHRATVEAEVGDLPSLRAWVEAHRALIDADPAAWCAIELALLDLFARREGATVDALLDRPPLAPSFRYTAVIGDAGPETVGRLAAGYATMGFEDFKLKLSGNEARDAASVAAVQHAAPPALRLRVDANNVWPSAAAAAAALGRLGATFAGVEEPVAGADYAQLAELSRTVGAPVILDEGLARVAQVAQLPRPVESFIASVRVSKMGGLLRSLEVVDAARARGLPMVVGAQVGETSLLTRAALTVATATGDALLGQEGAFGTHLLSRDIATRPLMFRSGALIVTAERPDLATPGWGVVVDDTVLADHLDRDH
jgi:L-alanine-DL-glutamate epimerase-like enolase superfamily enzyme